MFKISIATSSLILIINSIINSKMTIWSKKLWSFLNKSINIYFLVHRSQTQHCHKRITRAARSMSYNKTQTTSTGTKIVKAILLLETQSSRPSAPSPSRVFRLSHGGAFRAKLPWRYRSDAAAPLARARHVTASAARTPTWLSAPRANARARRHPYHRHTSRGNSRRFLSNSPPSRGHLVAETAAATAR